MDVCPVRTCCLMSTPEPTSHSTCMYGSSTLGYSPPGTHYVAVTPLGGSIFHPGLFGMSVFLKNGIDLILVESATTSFCTASFWSFSMDGVF